MATGTVNLNCARIRRPDLGAIDDIARIHLGVRRSGCDLQLKSASDELMALIEFAGLGDVLRVEVQRKPEQRKEPGRVKEEGELPDAPI
jgi:ABC-type transporter Mla MlaB component